MSKITRRSLFAGMAGISVAAVSIPAVAAIPANPDAELFALHDEWRRSEDRWRTLGNAWEAAYKRADKAAPLPRNGIGQVGEKARESINWSYDQTDRFIGYTPERIEAERQKSLAKYDRVVAVREAAMRRERVPELEAEAERAFDAECAAHDRFFETPAKSIKGIHLKLSAIDCDVVDGCYPLRRAIEDAERLAAGRAS